MIALAASLAQIEPRSVNLFDDELIRMTFVVGIAVSVLVYEKTHRTTGSLVVPGYVGAQLLNPVALAMTAFNALLTWAFVARFLPRFVAIYGRALFVINIFVSVLLSMLLGPVLEVALPTGVPRLDSIGYVIPALIAYDMNRQGPARTGYAVAGTSILASIPALLIVFLRPETVEQLLPRHTPLFPYDDFWLAVTALVSVSVATILHTGHGFRCGGFIGAMYVGLLVGEPAALLFIIGAALVTYGLVQHGLKSVMIVFGRRKFAIVLMLGSVLSWIGLELFERFLPGVLDFQGMRIAVLFVPALLANDMERMSIPEVLVGMTVSSTACVSTIVVASGLVDIRPIPVWALPAMLVSYLLLFAPHLAKFFGPLRLPQPASRPAVRPQQA